MSKKRRPERSLGSQPPSRSPSDGEESHPPLTGNMMEGIGHYAMIEWQELCADGGEMSSDPKHIFLLGYIFGTGLGLALSPRKPRLVKQFVQQYRERGWDV